MIECAYLVVGDDEWHHAASKRGEIKKTRTRLEIKAGGDFQLHKIASDPHTFSLKLWTCNPQSDIGFVFLLPFLLTTSHCVRACVWCVCVWCGCMSPTYMVVSPAASLTDKHASPHAWGEPIEGDSVSELSRQLWLQHTRTDLAVSFDLFPTWALTRLPHLPSLSPATLSLPVIAVHLLGSVSAGLSASLLQD